MNKRYYKPTIIYTLTALVILSITSVVLAAPAGPPPRPSAPSPDGSLGVHPLTYANPSVGNVLKGFAYWYYPGDVAEKSFPTTMEWHYFGLGDVMTGINSFDWEPVEKVLDEVASHGKQATLRFCTARCPNGIGVPPFLASVGYVNGDLLPYDNPTVMTAFRNFIAAFGAKYDGDPRIGFIHMGLVGYWGEWHTWPNAQYMPSLANQDAIIDAYNAAFTRTRLEIRYADLGSGGGAHLTSVTRNGYHDDSWCFRESENGVMGSMTLPQSLGGNSYAFVQLMLNAGAENKWTTASIGGEVRPEIQGSLFSGGGQQDNVMDCVEVSHATWMIDDHNGATASDSVAAAVERKMGYNLNVKNAYFNSSVSGSFKVGVQIQNDGVAPFYYGPGQWPVLLGVKDGSGNVVQTWQTNWDLRNVQPLQIRTLPDWGVGGTYMNYGSPYYFEYTVPSLGSGTYTLVMRVRNPLESISEADVRAKGHIGSWQPWYPARQLRFANTGQGSDGWLSLGNISVGGGGATWTPTRTNTPGAATNTPTSTNTLVGPTNTPTATLTRTNTPVVPTATRTNTPVAPTNTPTPGNVNAYEAEASGNTLAGGAVRAACGTCSGGNKVGYVGNNSGTLQFNGVNATSAGSYAMTIYYLSGEARSAQISVNGGAATTLNFASSGGWTTVGTLQTTVSLNAGGNTIKFSNSSGWAPDFDRIAVNTGGGPTNTPVVPTATRTNTPVPPTVTRTNTPGTPPPPTPTRTNTPVVPTATRTNTPVVPTATRTNTPVPPTVTPTAGATLMIDSFSNSSKWSSKLNDLNKAISWVMDSIYYGDPTPGNIVMNSSPSGQYYQETIAQSLAGKTTLTLRLRDWSDTTTELHWNVVLNDGTDHTVALSAYGNVTGSYTDINIPLSAFGANLANAQYLRIAHKDSTYAVLMIDAISVK